MIRTVVTMLLVGAAVLGGLRFANALATWNVKTVRLAGELTLAEGQEVQEAVAGTLAQAGFNGAGDVARAVQGLGWVRDVQVRRLWPDMLDVRVSRQTLAARWGDVGLSYLTTGGNVVSVPPDEGDPVLRDLPVLKASHATSAEAMRLYTLLDGIARTGDLRLDRLEQNAGGKWIATVAGSVEVVLGSAELGERFRRFLVVHERVLGHGIADVERVDARYEAGVAVRWRQPSQGADHAAGSGSPAQRRAS